MNRKTIRKIALVNWACFQREEISISGSTLFTGVNGSGKSTALDALTYLLTANTQFNLAAKDRDRTVKAYVRGDTKSNGKDQYLRTGEVVSYIAIEVVSETEQDSFVIGVCIESPSVTDKCTSYWFILKNTCLSDVRMATIEEGKLSVYPRKQMTVKGKSLKMSDFMGREKARSQILRTLGLRCDPEKYRSKLVKMMAFNPENNVDQFIQNCVLEPGNVNSLQELRIQKERFEELKGIYENLRISKEKLELVEQKTMEYESQNRLYLNRFLMLKYQDYLAAKDEKEETERAIKNLGQKRESIEKDIKQTEVKRDRARDRYDSAKNNPGYADVKGSIDSIENQLKDLGKEIEHNRECVRKLQELKEKIFRLKELLNEDWRFSNETEMVFDALGNTMLSADRCQEVINTLSKTFRELSDKYRRNGVLAEQEKEKVHQELSKVLEALMDLERKKVPYPEGAEKVRRIIWQELSKKHKDVQVRFFSELVQEIRDPSWRNAIETFLGRKRFYLVVDNAYVQEALQILNAKKLHETNIIIGDKLPESEIQKGSAAEILDIPNVIARKYANYLLNGIYLCDSVEELHNHPKGGLMRDGMLAKSYSATMMDMSKTMCYMGRDVIELQIREYQKKKKELEEKESVCIKQVELMKCRTEEIENADIRVNDYNFSAPKKLKANEDEYHRIEEEKSKLEKDPSFVSILEEVNRAKSSLDEIEQQLEKQRDERTTLNNEIENKKKKEKQLAADIFQKKNIYQETLVDHPEVETEMKTDYERLRKRSDNAWVVIKENTVQKQRSETDRAKTTMENSQLDYLRTAGMNLEKRGPSYIPFFNEEKKLISNVKIEEASNKLAQHAKEMESTFMTDFIAEMNESINKAKNEVNGINEELKSLPFGNDTYAFQMDEREDRREFFRICRKLNDYGSVEMLQSMNADDEELSDDIKSFMEKILSEPDECEYTDYRRYFKYDMKIRTKRGGKEIEADFSKKQGSASNGEKQTPYFIILAASLMQCYPRNVECIRVAFIDEAFAALSRERIEQMVKYLEDNCFQVMYAAPPEKISSIGDLIDTTISLVSSGKYTKIIEGLVRR